MQDYSKLYESKIKNVPPVEKLERIRRLVRQGLPHATAIALILIITRR